MKKLFLLFFLLTFFYKGVSQIKKFGKISKKEFNLPLKNEFKDANAIVLFKERKTYYDFVEDFGWQLVTIVHERIKIINTEGFDRATKKIPYYSNKEFERVSIKANTYNLQAGKVKKTKLKKKDIFNKKENNFWSSKKFTMPNISEGSIVEWEYKITSPFIHTINDVVVQQTIPTLHYKATITIPEFFVFKTNVSKYYNIEIATEKEDRTLQTTYSDRKGFNVTDHELKNASIRFEENKYIIVKNNIPALKEEPYINNLQNYIGKVKFELLGVKNQNSIFKSLSSSWEDVSESIYEREDFGGQLKKTRYFNKDLQKILAGKNDDKDKINVIFGFVKRKIKWNEYADFFTHDGVVKAYANGSGNVAEINLILVAMLRKAGLKANPVLVSTRSHGVQIFPTINGFNYVIAAVELGGQTLLLDATEKFSTINVLPKRVLNWRGRIIRKDGSSEFIDLFPKKYSVKDYRLKLKINETGDIESGNMQILLKNLKALQYRNLFDNLTNEKIIEKLEENLQPIEIDKLRVLNENKLNKPLKVFLQFTADNQARVLDNKMYINPLFMLAVQENVFKSEERKLPVDFASPWLNILRVQFEIPQGYKVEKLPENLVIETANDLGSFEYKITTQNNEIQLIVVSKIDIPIIPATMYKELKDFYTKRIKKMNEKIVLIKD